MQLHNLAQLIQYCRQGDALAWEQLVREYQPRIFGLAYYFLRNSFEAQECTQEAFIKVFRGLAGFQGSADEFVPWMLTITRNCCLDRLRTSKRKMGGEEKVKQELQLEDAKSEGPEELLNKEQIQSRKREEIYSVLDQFSEESREIILLKDIQGLKNEAVATMLDISLGTVKSRSSRARIKLAKALAGLNADECMGQV